MFLADIRLKYLLNIDESTTELVKIKVLTTDIIQKKK